MSILDPHVWFQVSGKYRIAARLPEGMTGVEALKTLNISEPEWAERMGEGNAGDHYLRCGNGEQKELTREESGRLSRRPVARPTACMPTCSESPRPNASSVGWSVNISSNRLRPTVLRPC